jgi:hypothetical protein
MNTRAKVQDIRRRLEEVTPGPWIWWGNIDSNNVHLRSTVGKRWDVMGFWRAGMQQAKPYFRSMVDNRLIADSYDMAIFQVCPEATDRHDKRVYRRDIIGFRNPDAAFIASAREDVETLLAYIDELETALDMQPGPVVDR